MKEYDLVVIGTGSAMNIVDPFLEQNPGARVAVIDKDEPGGICLTRGCIPTKILTTAADVVRTVQSAATFGIDAPIRGVDFGRVMERMRRHVHPDIDAIREGLSRAPNLDYFHAAAEFVAPYTLRVGKETLKGKSMFLCTGSRPTVPAIAGLKEAGYHTSDTILALKERPASMAIIGGGYIAAEFAHFFSAMGSRVTVLGRNARFLPDEEPEISELVRKVLGRHVDIRVGHEVVSVRRNGDGTKRVTAKDAGRGKELSLDVAEILVAAGRESTTDILRPAKGGIRVDAKGWIVVNEYLETSQPNVWAFGDATGVHMFKHKANHDSMVVYQNMVLGRRVKADYHAVPHAVFTHPEVAAVGLGERAAIAQVGEANVLIGFQRYEDTAKGSALEAKDYFAKVIVERSSRRILGAHVVGPQASVLLQEVVNLMYASGGGAQTLRDAMHIHPALSEVVERAFGRLVEPGHARHEIHAAH